jgi:thioesterase domain-containing protein
MHNEITLREAVAFLHEPIPITRVMGVRVVAQGNDGFIVEALVSLNSNHLQTGFGGSINAVATLAGHGLLWLELREDKRAHFVVAESSIRFRRPVRETIRAICVRPEQSELDAFKSTLVAKGKARIALKVTVQEAGAVAADFRCNFVALKS